LKVLLPCLVARKLFKLNLHGRIGSSQWQDPRMWSLVVEMSKKHMRQVSLHLTEFYLFVLPLVAIPGCCVLSSAG
jgi:hypothetical protein